MRKIKTEITSIITLTVLSILSVQAKDDVSISAHRIDETNIGYDTDSDYKFHVFDRSYANSGIFSQEQDIETRNLDNLFSTELTITSGFNVTDNFSIYDLIGQNTLDFDIDNSYPLTFSLSKATNGGNTFTSGVGFEFAHNNYWSLLGEYSQFNYVSSDSISEIAIPIQVNNS